MSPNYSDNFYPVVGDIVKVERSAMPKVTVSISGQTLNMPDFFGSVDNIPLTFLAEITKVSEGKNIEIEEIKVTKPPESLKFENEFLEKEFNEQFTIGKLITINQLKSKNFEFSFWQRG